jgi:hypothetical protein
MELFGHLVVSGVKTSSETELVVAVEFRFFAASCKFDLRFHNRQAPVAIQQGDDQDWESNARCIILGSSCSRLVSHLQVPARSAAFGIPGLATIS